MLPTYGGMSADQIEALASRAMGLDRPSLFGEEDALMTIKHAVIDGIHERAPAMTSDGLERADAARLFSALLDVASPGAREGRFENPPNENFARQTLSGEEARASLVDVLGGIGGEGGDRVRRHFGLPPASSEGVATTTGHTRSPLAFGHKEEGVAALVIATCIEAANIAIQQKRMVRPDVLFGGEKTRGEIEAAVLANDGLATGTEAEKRAIIESVYAKLLTLMREAFESHQAAARQVVLDLQKL